MVVSPIFFGSSAPVFFCGMPTTAVGPVDEAITPTFICASATGEASSATRAAARAKRDEAFTVRVPSGKGKTSGAFDQREHAQRAAAAALDLERRTDEHCPGRRQQVEVGEALQAVAAGGVHVVVAGVRRAQVIALAGVGADRLRAEAEHVALVDQESHRLRARPRRVLAGLVEVLIRLAVAPL